MKSKVENMQKAVKIPLTIIGVLVVVVVFMAIFKLCPPQGPWPMPPWCGEVTREAVAKNDFGCFPPSCSMIPDASGRQFCEDWKAGKQVMWATDCSSLPIEGCRKLCEHEKTIFVAEKINITNALIVPTDVSKIDYPNFYKKPATANVMIEYPYCAITKETVAYPVRYLGDHELPRVDGAPLPAGITRIIGIKDTWIPEPNLNRGCRSIGYAAMKEAYEKTLQRVKALGAEKITFTNFVHFSNFKNAEIDGPDKATVSEEDLRFVVTKAREQNLEVVLYLNLAPGKETVSDIPSASWLSTLIHNWEPFVLSQAKIAEETKVYAIMLNHFDYQPSIKGFEDTFQNEMLALVKKIRNVYSGKVLLMIDPVWGADLNKLDTLLKQVDGFIYTPTTNILQYESDKTVSVSHLKTLYLNNFAGLGRDFGKYNKPIYIRVLIQSSKEFLEKGWSEDAFCIARGGDPCYQKNLEVDFSAQAVAYEAMMEAIKQTHNNYLTVEGVDSYGYWFTDVTLPDVSQPQIAQSVRNKPAESIIKEWFMK